MRIWSVFLLSLAACSNPQVEDGQVDFEADTGDIAPYYDTTEVTLSLPEDSSADLAATFYAKYVSMFFDNDNFLVITPINGGVHFFDPHDTTEVKEVIKYKQFIEYRQPINISDTTPLSPYLLQQKIDSLLGTIKE